MPYPPKQIVRNFFAVCLGVTCSFGIFYFLFLATALVPQAWNTTFTLMILLGVSSFTGSFLAASFATRHKIILAMIGMAVMVIVYVSFFDTNFNDRNYPRELLQVGIICFFSLIGAVAGALPRNPPGKTPINKNEEEEFPTS